MSDSPTEHLEHAEHAEHAAHSGDPFLAVVSVTIAVLAVIAATIGSFETIESGKAITDKNESVLLQNKATDTWGFFQAQSIKKNMYDLAAAAQSDAGRQADYVKKARQYESDSGEVKSKAEGLEKERDAKLEESNTHEHRHHTLTAAVTFLHVSIAIATIAIIMRGKRWPWHGAMALGALGAILAIYAYL
ncbi:DUF4337 domain-containing protein [Lichenihabitans sp. PAMC28606]|uniref:DUF4337 family protein n=1 Tax=Lichenihabitans sp. PAMC28606 TaxID=2880932 RepID=UPI001D09F8A2|nr:DUF4337 family protein [Lichenihabitans sp. PAMC28606]UDL95464.1 DUF4337 domain-containing protein [Lichenihabitans sp. PAMC28606]